MIAGAAAELVPEHLRVHMGVAVDEARSHHVAFGVERLFGDFAVELADPRDLAVLHADIAPIAGTAGTVHHHAVLDNQIVAHFPFPSQNRRSRAPGTSNSVTQ